MTAVTSLGHAVFAGRRFPVTRIRMAEGSIRVTWQVKGPMPYSSGPVTFFGEDGTGIAQTDGPQLPAVLEGESKTITNIWVVGGVIEA